MSLMRLLGSCSCGQRHELTVELVPVESTPVVIKDEIAALAAEPVAVAAPNRKRAAEAELVRTATCRTCLKEFKPPRANYKFCCYDCWKHEQVKGIPVSIRGAVEHVRRNEEFKAKLAAQRELPSPVQAVWQTNEEETKALLEELES